MRANSSTRSNDAPKSYRHKVTPEDLAMAHPDYIVSNVVALTLLAAVAAVFLLFGYIAQEFAEQFLPALTSSP
jgi:hypothetical protein